MNLRGIVALIVDFERLAREHFGREHFAGVPGRFGGTGKVTISQSPRIRMVEGGHETTVALFESDAPHG